MFVLDRVYKREELHRALGGGSRQTYLPTRAGQVLAAFLRRELNPDAPEVILPGTGTDRELEEIHPGFPRNRVVKVLQARRKKGIL